MAKHIVIDAMARSGTTLMSAITRSQEKTICFCPGFNEPLSCSNMGDWPHGMCRQEFVKNAEIDLDLFKGESFSYVNDYSQYYGLSKKEWRSIIFDASSTVEIRENIEKALPHIEVFCYRWNQALCYFYEWTSRCDNRFWLSMIRNPLDRSMSSLQKHGWSVEDSLKSTVSFCEKLESVKNNDRLYLVHYEDLINNPESIMKSLYKAIGEELEEVNLTDVIGSNGKKFIPQTSENNHGEKIDGYIPGKEFTGLYDSKIGRYKKECSEETYELFRSKLIKFSFYERYFK